MLRWLVLTHQHAPERQVKSTDVKHYPNWAEFAGKRKGNRWTAQELDGLLCFR